MSIRKIILFTGVIGIMVALCGCSLVKTYKEEDNINSYYPSSETDKEDMAAVFYIGYGKDEKEENLPSFLEKYNLKAEDLEEVIDKDNSEWYVILPKYTDTELTVTSVQLGEDGELVGKEELTTTKNPILLGCNESDIMPSTKVTIRRGEKEIEYNPFMSLEDGSVNEIDDLYTKKIGK